MTDLRRTTSGESAAPKELSSWKEIATHLKVSTKTAQRWAADRGLPVRRIGARVCIDITELEEWRAKQKQGTDWFADVRLLQIAVLVLLGALVVSITVYGISWLRTLPGVPASALSEGSVLYIKDASGRTVWTHTFELPLLGFHYDPKIGFQMQDLDGDGKSEAIGVWQHTNRDSDGWSVQCFESDGRLRWDLKMNDRIKNLRGQEFSAPFVVRDLLAFDSPEKDGTKWIAVLFVHVADVPATLVVLDRTGRRRGQYWHVGHLNALELFDADGDGQKELLAGGVRHGVEQAVIVAFEPGKVGGANRMPSGHPRALLDKGTSTEKWVGYFARSEVSKRSNLFNYVSDLSIVNGRLVASVYERLSAPEAYLQYEFERGPKPKSITLSVAFLAAHQTQEMRSRFEENFPEQEVERLKREFRTERGQ